MKPGPRPWLPLHLTLLQRFTLMGLLVTACTGGILGVLLSNYSVQGELEHAANEAAMTATYLLSRDVTAEDFGPPTEQSVARWASRLRDVTERSDILRVKVFDPVGTLVYSDDPSIIGKHFGSEELQEALEGGIAAEVGQPSQVENASERSFGRLFEVYVPVRHPTGGHIIGVFEVYKDFAPIQAKLNRLRANAWSFSLLAYGILFLSLFAIVRSASRRLNYLAYHDPLTGIANRGLLQERTERALASTRGSGKSLALLTMDLARFKAVNDSFGHAAGDEVLRLVAKRLQASVRGCDLIARVGGDEFAVLLEDLPSESTAAQSARRLAEAMKEPFFVQGQNVHLGLSVGIALHPGAAASWGELLNHADTAMYQAKASNTDYQVYRPEMVRYTRERLQLEEDLAQAIDKGEFLLHYQPLFTGALGLVGVEALVRWDSPERGFVPPLEFIPLAEETGLIRDIDRYVIERAIRQGAAWMRAGTPLEVAVNLSPQTFRDPTLVDWLADVLQREALPAELLTLEVTERLLVQTDNRETLVALTDLGARIALDDFGTGYSSLAYLESLPIHLIKIDKHFVQGIGLRRSAEAIVKTVIALAENLGVQVLAEGVETEAQRAWLVGQGCGLLQGYLLGRPMPVERLAESVGQHFPGRPGRAGPVRGARDLS